MNAVLILTINNIKKNPNPDVSLCYIKMAMLTDLDWDVLVLTRHLSGEDVGNLCVGRGLPTDGTLDGTSP